MGGSSAPAPDQYASNKQAAVSREMYDYWSKSFKPLETNLIAEMNDPNLVNNTVAKANSTMGLSLDAAGQNQQREAGRYGITMSPERTASIARGNNLNRGLSTVSAENTARSAVDQYKTSVLDGTASLGRQTAGNAMAGFNTAASLEASRNAANRGINAQNDANTMGMVGTGLGLAAAFAM